MNLSHILRGTCARIAGAIAAAITVGALAGPAGELKFKSYDMLTNTSTFQIIDPEGIKHGSVFADQGGRLFDFSVPNCPVTIDITIDWDFRPAASKWVSIIWEDCQVKLGKERNHHHSFRVTHDILEPNDPRVENRTPLANGVSSTQAQNRKGGYSAQPLDDNRSVVMVTASGLSPNTLYEVWVQPNSNGDTSIPGMALVPGNFMTNAQGELGGAGDIPFQPAEYFGITLRRFGPSGTVHASGWDKDFDDDGVRNTLDNAPYMTNPDQLDSDGNGIGDRCDCDRAGGDDYNQVNSGDGSDANRNGVVDACERPACPTDYNGDGFINGDDFDEFVLDFEQGGC